jgi:hypothetical protein
MSKSRIAAALEAAGLVAAATGAALIAPAVGLLVLGAGMVAFGIAVERD